MRTRWLRCLTLGVVVGAAAWVLWWSITNGRAEQRTNLSVKLGAAPLIGRSETDGWVWRWGWSLAGAALLAGVIAAGCWRGWWWCVRQRWVVLATAVGAALFASLLALSDGLDGLRYGAAHETEYLIYLRYTPPAGKFLRTFISQIKFYSVHARGHPPGYLLILKLLHFVGLRGVWPVVVMSIVATGVAAAAVVLAVRAVAGDEWMRRVAPLLIVAPYAIWMMTSGDAVFTCVGALGVAAAAEGSTRGRRQALLFGLAAGLLFGFLLFLTYLGALMLVIPATLVLVALLQRQRGGWMVLVGGVASGLAVVGLFRIAGFWWFDGLAATKEQYHAGSAQFRDWSYFEIGNIGAALFALGPATVVGLGTLRSRRLWLLVGSASVALAASHLSRYTKGEVERIWLLFFPWIAIAAAGLVVRSRRWSGASIVVLQAGCAIVLQAALQSKW